MLSKLLRYFLLGLVLLLVFMASALLAMRFAIHGREVRVPKLAGLTPGEAERIANSEGLVISVGNHFYSSEIPEGRIVSQVPPPNATVRRGWKILLSQSLGPQRAAVPNLLGQSEHAADINLRRRGLEVGDVSTIHFPGATPQTVIAQSPPANATGVTSPRVGLILVSPDSHPAYVMPSFVGKPLAESAAALEQAGLNLAGRAGVQTALAAKHKSVPRLVGTVVKQYPLAGQKVMAGSTVYFTVRK